MLQPLFYNEYWMRYALFLAHRALEEGEVPVGAVLVYKNEVIGEGWNCMESCHDPTAHAEIVAMRQGGRMLKNNRLLEATLYVTLEPCVMCSGAMVHSRICHLIYGAKNKKIREITSLVDLFNYPGINHLVDVTGGVLLSECSSILSNFFRVKREKRKKSRLKEVK